MTGPRHPAKFTDSILIKIGDIVANHGPPTRMLDPFAGTGRIHQLPGIVGQPFETVGVELEPEWASMHPKTIVANTLRLPFADGAFDALCTSPCYGNRFADHHNARDGSRRRSYTHDLGRALHLDNSGALQWGDAYRDFHERAWMECLRVLRPDSLVVINISNHIRKGEEQHVTEWHMTWFMSHGCAVEDIDVVATPRLRDGANADARARHEYVFALRYVAPVLTPDEEEHPDADDALDLSPQWPVLVDDLDTAEGS